MSKLFKGSRKSVRVRCVAENIVDGNRINKVSFYCTFTAVPNLETRQMLRDAQDESISDEDIVDRYLIGWEGVVDEDDQPIEYTPENVDAAMDVNAYRAAIITGFMQSVFGKEALRQKNS